MNILYITNVCDIGSILCEEAAQKGIHAQYIDYPWAKRKLTNFFDFLIFLMKKRLLDFDIFHYNWPIDTLLPKNKDIAYFKGKGKTIVAHYHGNDIRNKKERESLKNLDKKIISTPDLKEFLPDAEWIPFPYNIRDMKERKGWNDTITIVHAPSNRSKKGTACIMRALKNLQKKYTLQIEIIEGKPNSYVLHKMKSADIVIDQVGPGWYGKVTIEALYAGAIPCFYIDPALENVIPEHFFVNITETRITQQIAHIIEDESLRNTLRKRGYTYIREYHDSRTIMDRLLALYTTE
jgi:hypothetical protein